MAGGGKLIVRVALSADSRPFPVKLALKRSLTYRHYVYTEVTQDSVALQGVHAFMAAGVRAGVLRLCIDRAFALADVVAARAYPESNQQYRKVVMTVQDAQGRKSQTHFHPNGVTYSSQKFSHSRHKALLEALDHKVGEVAHFGPMGAASELRVSRNNDRHDRRAA